MTQCPWKIHWGVGLEQTTRCEKEEHLPVEIIGEVCVEIREGEHEGPTGIFPDQKVIWQAGDRREFTGDWPGFCTKLPGKPYTGGGCTLHVGHHGRCAP